MTKLVLALVLLFAADPAATPADSPPATPVATATATPTAKASSTASATPAASAAPSPKASATAKASLSPVPSPTPDAAAAAARLEEARRRVDEIHAQLANDKEKEKSLLAKVDELDLTIADMADDLHTIEEQVAKVRAQSEEHKASMERIRSGITRKKAWLARRVRSAFIHGRPGYLKVLFSAESYPDLVQKTRFQAIITRRDAQMVGDLRKDLAEVAKNRADYDEDLSLFEDMQKQAAEKVEKLAVERDVRQGLLDRVRGELSGDQTMVTLLESRANELASSVGGLQGGSTEVVAPKAKFTFDQAKGHLRRPVSAPVKLGFGPYKHPKLGLPMVHQGVSYAAAVGTEVHAVADGTVELSRWFSSYGQVLVIDHGDGWRSLYAHNGRLLKKVGDSVREGDVVADSGDTGSLDGPELYFAIFREGKPVDPAEWLSR